MLRNRGQVFFRGQNPFRTDQALDLKQQRIKCGEVDEAERAQKDPSRNQPASRAAARVKQPSKDFDQLASNHHRIRILAGPLSVLNQCALAKVR